jgi:hypothetical protein
MTQTAAAFIEAAPMSEVVLAKACHPRPSRGVIPSPAPAGL